MNGTVKKSVIFGLIYGLILSAGAFFFVENRAPFVLGVWGGICASYLNLALLKLAVPMFVQKKQAVFAVFIYVGRIAIYGLGIYLSVKAGEQAAIGFALGALGLIPAVVTMKNGVSFLGSDNKEKMQK